MEPFDPANHDLAAQMNAAVDGVAATPDLAGVMAGADRRRRRSRSLSLGGAAAVVALGVGGVVMVSNRDTNQFPAAQPDPVVVPLTTLAPGVGNADSPSGDETATTDVVDQVPVSTVSISEDGQFGPNAPDPADEFLDQTEEIYRREMPSGYDFQIRQSNVSYGELFGIKWNLPTGSQAECLGRPAVFIGSSEGDRLWVSSWTAQQWWPIGEENDFQITEQYFADVSNIVIRTELDGVSAGILQGDTLADSAEFVNGVAVIELGSYGNAGFDEESEPILSIAVRLADGAIDVQTLALYSSQYGYEPLPEGCLGPERPAFPGSKLPPPGTEQPVDVAGAEALVRERHAILVDRSDAEKPADILTDDTGVADARAEMDRGEYGASASVAVYTIDEVVFTDAEHAFFEYTIVAPTGNFAGRFGEAIFNGEVWQITRQTICQDLWLAGGRCSGVNDPERVQPPPAVVFDFEAEFEVWSQVYEQYGDKLYCNPISPCGEFDLSARLPDPGEQPDNADVARAEVINLMESLYGNGALLAQLDRIVDPTGIAEAVEQLAAGTSADEVDSATVTVDELVFTDPTVALFRYTLVTAGYTFTDRIGFAKQIDGVWKVARDTVCDDLALGGSGCGPDGAHDVAEPSDVGAD